MTTTAANMRVPILTVLLGFVAVLAIDAAAPDDTVPQLPITLAVDGETLTITERDGGHDYTWTTGPNPGYLQQ
ncbi:hypothetical protein [Williamsia soli]|uniref:hypothetical protein n=1 Tax=Williamsia soli TaxID=364929 RepID=UPI001A9CBD8B|nr:hypothetical protein [Williamsia soli]